MQVCLVAIPSYRHREGHAPARCRTSPLSSVLKRHAKSASELAHPRGRQPLWIPSSRQTFVSLERAGAEAYSVVHDKVVAVPMHLRKIMLCLHPFEGFYSTLKFSHEQNANFFP